MKKEEGASVVLPVLTSYHKLDSSEDEEDQQMNSDLWTGLSEEDHHNVLNSTRLGEDGENFSKLDPQMSPVRSLKIRIDQLKEKAIKTLPQPANLQERYQFKDIQFKLNSIMKMEDKDKSSIMRLKEKFTLFSQLQKEEEDKNNPNFHPHLDPTEKSNYKLLALKKSLKVKMMERRRKDYEKRIQLYKMGNEINEAKTNEKHVDEYDEEEDDRIFNEEEDDRVFDEEENETYDRKDEKDVEEEKDGLMENDEMKDGTEEKHSFDNRIDDSASSGDLYHANEFNLGELMPETQTQTNSQDLLELCSAKVPERSFVDEDDMIDKLCEFSDEIKGADENQDSDESVKRKKYNFDSDDEDMDDFTKQLNFKLKNKRLLIEDDDEEKESQDLMLAEMNYSIDEEADEDEQLFDSQRVAKSGKCKTIAREFIEDQAELSDEDADAVSSDEEENGVDEYEQEIINEDLPSEDEIMEQNNKIFWKQQLDEDKRELLEYQERFLENGDMQNDSESRQRKFKWKNVSSTWVDSVRDSDDEGEDENETIEYRPMQLKQLTELKIISNESESAPSQYDSQNVMSSSQKCQHTVASKSTFNSFSTFNNSCLTKHIKSIRRELVNGPSGDIQSYIIKDKNLVKAMSLKRPNNNVKDVAKRFKADVKNDGKSIFDVFQF